MKSVQTVIQILAIRGWLGCGEQVPTPCTCSYGTPGGRKIGGRDCATGR